MRLDWNDIKARAAKFAAEWKDAQYERGETQTFYNEFFELFGVTRRRVASFELGVILPDKTRGSLDLFWKGKLLVEHKSAGRNLTPARKQALDYFPGLKEHELPRYILLSDFQNFELYDLDIAPDRPVRFRLQELPDHVQDFGFITGQERRVFRDQDPVNILASEILARCTTRSTRRAIAATSSNVSWSAFCFASSPTTPRPIRSERVEHLFGLYEKLTAPILTAAAKPKRGRKK